MIISKKSIPNNVVRNSYRRMFYETCRPYIEKNIGDIACVIKTKTKLTRDPEILRKTQKEILYLLDTKL